MIGHMTCPQGTTFRKTITLKNADGTPMDLTGFSVAMEVRESFTSPSAVLSLSLAEGITLDAEEGKIFLYVPAGDTAALNAGSSRAGKTYRYDIELTNPSGEVSRILEGDFIVTPEVTRGSVSN